MVIPGLSTLTGASDFKGYFDLYDGTLHESGGGMTLTAYVRADAAQLVVDVTGADPTSTQTAQVKLWSGRTPTATGVRFGGDAVADLDRQHGDRRVREDVRRDGRHQRGRPERDGLDPRLDGPPR